MYRLFCENFRNYLKINSYTEDVRDERYKMIEPLFTLADVSMNFIPIIADKIICNHICQYKKIKTILYYWKKK